MPLLSEPSVELAYRHNADLPAGFQEEILRVDREARAHHGGVRRVLLIGGGGYIGGALTQEFLRVGYAVRTLDINVYRNNAVARGYLCHPEYEFVAGGMGDESALERALDGVQDVVILAGLVGDPITKAYPEAHAQVNERALASCLEQLNGHGLGKVVFLSTCSNYGIVPKGGLANEETPLSPLSLYAQAKVAAEQKIQSMRGGIDFSPTILRFATAFGLAPRMRFDLTINEFTRELALGRELLVYDEDTWRPYCHVRDFARLVRRVLEVAPERTDFEVFNAGGNANNFTKRGIIDLLRERIPGAKVTFGSGGGDPRDYRVDFSKLEKRLLFVPAISVASGIAEILAAINMRLFDDVDASPKNFGNYEIDATRL